MTPMALAASSALAQVTRPADIGQPVLLLEMVPQRRGARLAAAFGHALDGLVDAPVARVEEMVRLQEIADLLQDAVVHQDRAEQRHLDLQIGWKLTIGGLSSGGASKGGSSANQGSACAVMGAPLDPVRVPLSCGPNFKTGISVAMHRLIALEGATNFRDLGGYEALDGRRVRWRRLFRADGLHRLTPGDGGALAALGLEEALDLRYGPERAGEPARLPAARSQACISALPRPPAPRCWKR